MKRSHIFIALSIAFLGGLIGASNSAHAAVPVAGNTWSCAWATANQSPGGFNYLVNGSGTAIQKIATNGFSINCSSFTDPITFDNYSTVEASTSYSVPFDANTHTWQSCDQISGTSYPGCNPDFASGFYYGTTPASITFSFPTDGTTTAPFFYWQVDTFGLSAISPDIIVISSEWNGTSTLNINDPTDDGAIYDPVSTTQQIPAHLTPTTFPTSTYYAEAWAIHHGSSTPFADTGIISFVLDQNATSTQNPNGTITNGSVPVSSSENCQYTSSSIFLDPIGNIREGICSALTFLFIPSASEQDDLGNRFSLIGSSVENKPPFGYFTSAAAALSFSSSTASTTLMDASTTTALSSIISPLDLGMASFISFLVVMWLFHRGRLIELS